jgi:hypothetical protein
MVILKFLGLLGIVRATAVQIVFYRSILTGKFVMPVSVNQDKTVWAVAAFDADTSEFRLRDCQPFVQCLDASDISDMMSLTDQTTGIQFQFRQSAVAGGPDTAGLVALGPRSDVAKGNQIRISKRGDDRKTISFKAIQNSRTYAYRVRWTMHATVIETKHPVQVEVGFDFPEEILIPDFWYGNQMGLILPSIDKESGLRFYFYCDESIPSDPTRKFDLSVAGKRVHVPVRFFPKAGVAITMRLRNKNGGKTKRQLCPTNVRKSFSTRNVLVGIYLLLEMHDIILRAGEDVILEPHTYTDQTEIMKDLPFTSVPLFMQVLLGSTGFTQVWKRAAGHKDIAGLFYLESIVYDPEEKALTFSRVQKQDDFTDKFKKFRGLFTAPRFSVKEDEVVIYAEESVSGTFAGSMRILGEKIVVSFRRIVVRL